MRIEEDPDLLDRELSSFPRPFELPIPLGRAQLRAERVVPVCREQPRVAEDDAARRAPALEHVRVVRRIPVRGLEHVVVQDR